jgi:hypothetical protein
MNGFEAETNFFADFLSIKASISKFPASQRALILRSRVRNHSVWGMAVHSTPPAIHLHMHALEQMGLEATTIVCGILQNAP